MHYPINTQSPEVASDNDEQRMEFIQKRLPSLNRDICFHAQCGDWEKMQESANELNSAGVDYGYPVLAETAKTILLFLKQDKTDRAIHLLTELDKLIEQINLHSTADHYEE